MMNRSTPCRFAPRCLTAVLCVLMLGCNTNRGPSPMELMQAQYRQGDYARAQTTAARAVATTQGEQRDLAHYMGGMSAYRLDNLAVAERYLRAAARSGDDSLAADASSTLGLIYSRQSRFADAADSLLHSARLQKGEDRARAYFYAGIAQQKLGRWPQARTSLLLAQRSTRDLGLAGQIDQQLAVTGYTIQVGAFAQLANADKVAADYAARARSLGLGATRIVTLSGRHRGKVNLVQVGYFATFDAASAARRKLGDHGTMIVPLQR